MRRVLPFLILSILFGLSACGAEPKGNSIQFFALDTPCSVTLQGAIPDSTLLSLETEVLRIEALMSSYREDSEISLLNRNGEQQLSSDTLTVLREALRYAQQSQGLFDPSIGALSQLWDITGSRALDRYEQGLKSSKNLPEQLNLQGDISGDQHHYQIDSPHAEQVLKQRKPPAPEQIQEALALVDYRNIELELDAQHVRLKRPGMKLDFGGIAKGFAADQIAQILKNADAPAGVIDLGGNILLYGTKENGSPWSVGVRGEGDSYLLGIFLFEPQAVVTSGIYQRYFEYEGKRYHHILSTQTGYPVENELFSVTVITQTSMAADAWATTLFIYGLKKGLAELKKQDQIEAIFVTKDKKVYTSRGIAVLDEKQYQAIKNGALQSSDLPQDRIWLFRLEEDLQFPR